MRIVKNKPVITAISLVALAVVLALMLTGRAPWRTSSSYDEAAKVLLAEAESMLQSPHEITRFDLWRANRLVTRRNNLLDENLEIMDKRADSMRDLTIAIHGTVAYCEYSLADREDLVGLKTKTLGKIAACRELLQLGR